MRKRVNTFDKSMTPEEAEREKHRGTTTGEALKSADEQYSKRRKKQ